MHGWEGTLAAHKKIRDDPRQPRERRYAADKAIQKILAQLKDKKLVGMREQLVGAHKAGDEKAIISVTKQIRAHNGEDPETGLYE
jgi:hypothetical protein